MPAYFLPWDNRGAAVQMTIPASRSTDVREHPNLVFMTVMDQGAPVKTTQRALDFKAKLGKHDGDTVEILDVIPWGAVFGLRKGSDWTFYLQENANITYYPRRKIQQVVVCTRGTPVSYTSGSAWPGRCAS